MRQSAGSARKPPRATSCAGPGAPTAGLAAHKSIENSAMPSAPQGTMRALILPRRMRLHSSEPNPTPTENTVRNRVTTASSLPSWWRT